jgi:cytochrome c peroxidase
MIKKIVIPFIASFTLAFTVTEVYQLRFPSYFPKPNYDFKKNPLSEAKIELGRALFYDPVLSRDNTISCASCHSSFNSFAHTDHALSHGIADKIGTRNAPALMNLAWHQTFMWDGAINHLDVQALAPITHPKEMGEKIENVVAKLQASNLYKKLFQEAFKDTLITGEKVLKALSQFQLTLVSGNSKYDRVKLSKEKFTAQEQKGYSLFQKNCNVCHTEPLFSNYTFANNGLPLDTTLNDFGKWTFSKQSGDSLKFKIPTLRNLSYTYPYMHDGRFTKLNQVLNHYTNGIKKNATLAPELKIPIKLSSDEKADLIAFLLTINDVEFVFNPKFSYPKEILLPAARK